ncbi:MAG: hypothetical protein LBD24_06080 [Spirochaetaceae bacterium]|nr:hypothetical protein [Spirochaetaceae bacterium]
MHYSETTGGHAGTVGDGPRLNSTDSLTGHGVALFGNNRRPCLKQPEAAGAPPYGGGKRAAARAPCAARGGTSTGPAAVRGKRARHDYHQIYLQRRREYRGYSRPDQGTSGY